MPDHLWAITGARSPVGDVRAAGRVRFVHRCGSDRTGDNAVIFGNTTGSVPSGIVADTTDHGGTMAVVSSPDPPQAATPSPGPIEVRSRSSDQRAAAAGWSASVRRDAMVYVAIFLVALVVRLVYLSQVRTIAFFETLVGDAASYDAWAQRIQSGNWWGGPTFYQAPAYPYFLGVLYALFGHHLMLVRIVQALMGAAACVVVAAAGRRFIDRSTGFLAGGLLALYAPAIFYDGLIQKTSLALLALAVLLWCVGWANHRRKASAWASVGVILGLLVLTRENAMLLAPVLMIWIVTAYRSETISKRLIWSVALLAGVAITLAPVTIRNRIAGGEWAITTVQAGPNFYIGNHEGATGLYVPLVAGHESPPFERDDAKRLAEQAVGHSLTDAQVSHYWLSQALSFIRQHPLDWLRLLGRKLLLATNAYEITDVEGYNVYRAYSPLLGGLGLVFHFGVLLPLAVLGIWATAPIIRRHLPLLVIGAALLVSIVLFYVLGRYRFVLVPVLCIYASAGIIALRRHLVGRRWAVLAGPLLIAAGVAVMSNRPVAPQRQLDAMAYGNLATVLAQRGDLVAATSVFAMALEENPDSGQLHYNMGLCRAMLGDWSGAIKHFTMAKSVQPDLVEVDYQLGVAYEQTGRIADAIRHYRTALRINPADQDANQALKRLGASPSD